MSNMQPLRMDRRMELSGRKNERASERESNPALKTPSPSAGTKITWVASESAMSAAKTQPRLSLASRHLGKQGNLPTHSHDSTLASE